MAAPLLTLQDIHLTFGGAPLLTGAELSVSEGDRLALIGRNGSGKSTLLKIAAGLVECDRGERFAHPGATIRYLPQEPDLTGFATTLSYVEAGLGEGDDIYRAQYLLEQLGLTGHEDPAHLSGGEARRAALARVLAPEPDILLLDEPTNHLDLPAIEWLESEIRSMRSAIILISHDRRFLEGLSKATVWLDRGTTRRMERGFTHFEAWRDEILEQEEQEQHKLDRKIERELHWVRYGVTARRKRNVRRMGELAALKQQRKDHRRVTGTVNISVNEAEISGKLVIEAKNICKSYDGRPIVKDVSTRILRHDRIAIVGPNGAGKSTLLKLLTGEIAPDSGTVKLGTNLEIATLDQGRAALDPNSTLAEVLTGGRGDTITINGENRHVVGYMKDFLFGPEQARTPVHVLSGGERGRLLLAKALAMPSNLLILDEPTNDLDLETLDLLQEMIGDYPGTVLLVSHDRDFLDRVATCVMMAEGNGVFREYAGGYTDMVNQRGAGVAARTAATKAAKAEKAVQAAKPEEPAKKRMSFGEQHELKTLPVEMKKLEAQIAVIQQRLGTDGLYEKNPAEYTKLATMLAAAQDKLTRSEERWLELEMLREECGG